MHGFLHSRFKLVRKYKRESLEIVTFFMLLVILTLGIINFIRQQNINAQNIRQIKQIATNIDTLLTDQAANADAETAQGQKQIQTISQELQCIGDFFAQGNRSTATIANLDNCTILNPASLNSPATKTKTKSSPAPKSTPAGTNNQSSPSAAPPPPPQSKPSLICNLTFNLLGC